jgi:hypothetical protein
MKKKLIPVNLSKKTRKATTKTAPASAAYARLFIGREMRSKRPLSRQKP